MSKNAVAGAVALVGTGLCMKSNVARRTIVVGVLALSIMAAARQVASSEGDSLDRVISEDQQLKLGWRNLSGVERSATAELLQALSRERASLMQLLSQAQDDEQDAGSEGWKEPAEFLEAAGWKRLTCGIRRVDGGDCFVVQDRFSSWATDDVPIGVWLRGDRKCWCLVQRFGGISDIIVGGRKSSFRFADWKELR